MRGFIKDMTITIIVAAIIVIFGTVLLIVAQDNVSIKNKELATDTYILEYDSTWKLRSNDDDSVRLKHKNGSIIDISIDNLPETYKYSNLSSTIDNVLYSIEKENKGLKLLKKEIVKINKSDSYKVLYEKGDNESLVTIMKKGDKLIIFELTADTKYIDILSDSYNEIVKGFRLNHENIDLSGELDINKSKIKWSKNKKISNNLKDKYVYEISDLNYKVSYRVPEKFILQDLNTLSNRYIYSYDESKVTITTSIKESNIYEYLNKNKDNYTIYYNYKDLNNNKDYQEDINKLKEDTYIYKNTYTKNKTVYENSEIVYILDYNHIFIIKISTINAYIPEELIESFELISTKNIPNNINRIVKDNKLILSLKYFKDSKKSKINEIDIKLPNSYKELDKNNNMYNIRYAYKNDYNVKYYLTKDIGQNNEIITSNYEVYDKSNLSYVDEIVLNTRQYYLYNGIYYDKLNMINTKILYTKIDDNYLVIEISSTNEIKENILEEVTDIEENMKVYEGEI